MSLEEVYRTLIENKPFWLDVSGGGTEFTCHHERTDTTLVIHLPEEYDVEGHNQYAATKVELIHGLDQPTSSMEEFRAQIQNFDKIRKMYEKKGYTSTYEHDQENLCYLFIIPTPDLSDIEKVVEDFS